MTHVTRNPRSFPLAYWRQIAHYGMFAIIFLCVLACAPRLMARREPTVALALLPLDALIHATIVQFVVILLLVSTGILRAGWRTMASLRALQAIKLPPPPSLLGAANGIVPPNALNLLVDDRPYAACLGLWRPVIYITSGLLTQVTPEALRAAIAHEEMHRRRRDPLRLLTLRVLARRLGPASCIVWLLQQAELRAEVLADRFAQEHTSRAALAAAILAVMRGNMQQDQPTLPAFFATDRAIARLIGTLGGSSHSSVFDERLRYLTMPPTSPLPRLLPTKIWSLRTLSAFWSAFVSAWRLGFALVAAVTIVSISPISALGGSFHDFLSCALHI